MKNYLKIICLHLIIIISIILCSCGASHSLRHELLFKAVDFSYKNLQNNTLIISGVSSQSVQLTSEERVKYSTIVSNTILEKLKDAHKIHIMNNLHLIDKIGKEQYFNMMAHFDSEQTIDITKIDLLRDSLPDAKYILFAYIQNENIIDNSYDDYIENNIGEKRIETTYEKTYLLTIEFLIYDLLQEKLVLNNVIYNEAYQTESRTTRTGCTESCIDSIIQNILFGEATEIGRKEVIIKISEKFTKELTKQ